MTHLNKDKAQGPLGASSGSGIGKPLGAVIVATVDKLGLDAMDDLLIQGGNVIDGTSAPARRLDVAVRGDRIVALEPNRTVPARRVIDARGHVVAPGFIDIKTHSDFTLPLYPRAESRVHQGITTELIGSCGFTAAPIPVGRLPAIADYLAPIGPALQLQEVSFAQYMDGFP